ncbi:MAG: TPM domain-containing protein [Chitinophagaceae bacterium]|nr:TPM domain-containing protein [Chitinophagaceae bacterium]
MFSLFKKKAFFSAEENEKMVDAIRSAEMRTSGEVRVFVESRCSFIDSLDRAVEIFSDLKMQETVLRNAVLVYVALKDRQLAVFADTGIHEKVGDIFWIETVNIMLSHFNKENYAEGISSCVNEIGEALAQHFPYDKELDKNELPDEIIFGR